MNETNSNSTSFFESSWVPVQCSTIILLVTTFWILICFIKHGLKERIRKSKSLILSQLAALSTVMTALTMISTLIITCIAVLYGTGERGDYACEVAMDLSIVLFYLTIVSTYFFLWYRQRLLYNQPSLQYLKTKIVSFFSWFSILLILFGGAVSVVIFIEPLSYKLGDFGCISRSVEFHTARYLAAGLLVVSQLLIFALFCHPLIKQKAATRQISKRSVSQKPLVRTEKRLSAALFSTLKSTAVCIVSDILTLILATTAFPETLPAHWSSAFYDFSLFVNIISVIFCFEDRKEIFCSFCKNKVVRNETIQMEAISPSSLFKKTQSILNNRNSSVQDSIVIST